MQLEELSAGHGALKAVRTGKGPDIVALHSLLTDRHAYDAVLPALAAKHRVTLINLPGFHGSQPPLLPLLDAYVAAIEDGFDEFKIGNAILIGNGFGGTLALAFALAHPERLAKLVLVGAAAAYPQDKRDHFAAMAREGAGSRAIDAKAFEAACKILQDTDMVTLLHHLRVPTLVACGDADQTTPPALCKEIAAKAPDASYVELPGCGPCPPLEQPEAFVAAIKEFASL